MWGYTKCQDQIFLLESQKNFATTENIHEKQPLYLQLLNTVQHFYLIFYKHEEYLQTNFSPLFFCRFCFLGFLLL